MLAAVAVQSAPDVIKRWVNEVQTALTTKTDMVQYHALALLRTIKQADKLAVSKVRLSLVAQTDCCWRSCSLIKLLLTIVWCVRVRVQLVTQLMKSSLRSPLATCLLIRYTAALMKDEGDQAVLKAGYDFLESCLRHKSEMVIYEASKAICDLPGLVAKCVPL